MASKVDQLVAMFARTMPERVAAATDHWLAVEQGETARLTALLRLLHTIKGEAQMLDLQQIAELAERAEEIVQRVANFGGATPRVGDALLGAFERMGLTAAAPTTQAPVAIDDVLEQLEAAGAEVGAGAAPSSAPPGRSSGRPSQRATASSPPAGEPAAAERPPRRADEGTSGARGVSVAELEPLLAEVRRLHGEQAVVVPRLREVQRMVRSLLRAIDPRATPEQLAERVVKTLGYGGEIEARLGAVLTEWSANEFAMGIQVSQAEELVRRASVETVARLEAQIHRVARSTAAQLGKVVDVVVRGDALLDTSVERRLAPALLHLVRNAIDHGIEPVAARRALGKPEQGRITVNIEESESMIRVTVEDDGGGIAFDKLREQLGKVRPERARTSDAELLTAIFEHGVTARDATTNISGRGVGLDVVVAEVSAVGGRVHAETTAGVGTRFVLTMPANLRVDVILPVVGGRVPCGIPSRVVREIVRIERIEETTEGSVMRIGQGDESYVVPLRSLAAIFALPGVARVGDAALLVDHPLGAFAISVDGYQNPRPIAARPVSELAFRSPLVRAVAPTPDGGVLLVLDVYGLHAAARQGARLRDSGGTSPRQVAAQRHVLVVEDAPVARELLCGMLRSFGLRVTEGTDGHEGLVAARKDPPDVVLTDIEMPVMDGFQMIEAFRSDPRLAALPVVVLTTRTDDSWRERANALGVRSFISKRHFVEKELRATIDACFARRG